MLVLNLSMETTTIFSSCHLIISGSSMLIAGFYSIILLIFVFIVWKLKKESSSLEKLVMTHEHSIPNQIYKSFLGGNLEGGNSFHHCRSIRIGRSDVVCLVVEWISLGWEGIGPFGVQSNGLLALI